MKVSVEDFKASIVFDKIVDAKLKAETDNEIKTIIKSAKKQLLDNIASAYMSVDKFLDIQIDSVILNKYQEYITETDKAPEDSTIYNAAIEKMYKETKASSIVVTHQMSTIKRTADIVLMIYKGEKVFEGTPEEMLHSGNDYTKQFVAASLEGPMKMLAE